MPSPPDHHPGPAAESTLREIDLRLGREKGCAFRAFKRALPELVEGRDYRVLRAEEASEQIAELRGSGRIYPSSRNVVLLRDDAVAKILVHVR